MAWRQKKEDAKRLKEQQQEKEKEEKARRIDELKRQLEELENAANPEDEEMPGDEQEYEEEYEEGYWEDDQDQPEQWTWTEPEEDKGTTSKESSYILIDSAKDSPKDKTSTTRKSCSRYKSKAKRSRQRTHKWRFHSESIPDVDGKS